MILRACCTDPAGILHLFSTPATDGRAELDGAGVVLPSIPLFPRLAHNGRTALVVFKDGAAPNPGQTWVWNTLGQSRVVGLNHGTWSVWASVDPDGTLRATWIDADQTHNYIRWMRLHDDLTTESEGVWPNPLGHAGLLGLNPDQSPIIDNPENRGRAANEVWLTLPLQVGDWVVGQANSYPPGVLVANLASGQTYRVFTGDVQVPPLLAVSGDQVVVAISSPTATRFYTTADFVPYQFAVAPYGAPKLIGVIYGSAEPDALNHGYGYSASPGNAEVLFGDYLKMVVKGRPVIANAYSINVPADKLLGGWNDGAISTAPPTFFYDDRPGELHSGQGDVLLLQAYPTKGEPLARFHGRLWDLCTQWQSRRKILVAKGYRGNPPVQFTDEELEPYWGAYDDVIRRPDVDGLLAFAWLRPDGLEPAAGPGLPRCKRWYTAMATAAGPELPVFPVIHPPPIDPNPAPTEDPMRVFMYDKTKPVDTRGYAVYDNTEGTAPGQCLGTKVPVTGAAEGGFAIRRQDGKLRALTPQGNWDVRDAVGGDPAKPGSSWELFYPTRPGGMSAPRDGKSYYFETIEQV